jgi:hypothetical protein
MPEIPAIMMRFRRARIAVVGDIQAAFLQLELRERDRDVTRFLWLKDIRSPPSRQNLRILRYRRVAFEVVASPFLIQERISRLLQEEGGEVGRLLQGNIYVDNLFPAHGRREHGVGTTHH